MYIRSLAFAALVFAGHAAAQGVNCTLLAHQDLHPPYANIDGYLAPNGHEYALLGSNSGTAIVDCTVPTAPIERGFIPGTVSQWRELQVYGRYCYVVTEGSGGFQVIDLNNPDAPVLVGLVGAANFTHCHSITVDQGTGRIYCNGTNAGTVVYDASVTPANPTFVGIASPAGNSNYWHDCHASNGYAYASMIYNGQCRILNTTVFPPATISNISTPSLFTHNAWPNAGHTVLATTDEVTGAVVKFWNITNKAAPVPLGQYTTNPASIPHNAYIVGNLCHVSWYTEGYILLDITDPNNPIEVASYDTWSGASGGFNGAWGVYPFMPSGNIYIMDISTGLYIVRPSLTDLAIVHTPLGNTQNEDGPYVVRATVTSSNPITSVTLSYAVNGGSTQNVSMTPTGNPNEYGANIPGQLAVSTVRYHVTANDSVGSRQSPSNGDNSFLVGNVQQAFFDACETDNGWTHGFVTTQDDWQRGSSAGFTGISGSVNWADPVGAYSGSGCWGNDLGIGNFNGAYQNNVSNWLQSPLISTTGIQGLHLRFRRWLTLYAGDTARVLVNGNTVFTTSAAVNDPSWQAIDIDISAIANTAPTLTLRYELVTNATNVSGGWTIDDVEVSLSNDLVPPVHYGVGTPGTGSVVPTIGLNGFAQIGTSCQATGGSMLVGAGCFLVLGFSSANQPQFGITGLVDTNGAAFVFNVASGAGSAGWTLTVPNNLALDNLHLFAQVIAIDAGSPGGLLSSSDGMSFRVCRG